MRFLFRWLLHAAIIMLVAHMVAGIEVHSFWTALGISLALGLVNALIRPLLILLTLPAVVLTFGLFMLVINAIGLWLVAALVPGFSLSSFWHAILASFLISLLSAFGRWLLSV